MRARTVLVSAIALSGIVLSLRCGGDGTVGMFTPPPESDAATLAELQDEIFTPRCALPGCHASPSPQQGLDLSPGVSHGGIVGVAATEISVYLRVVPGDAANSYLVMKLEGDARIVGERMPFGGPYLGAAEISRVRSWIDAGARND